MIIKKMVAVSLITSFTALAVIIVGGLFVPTSFFQRLIGEESKPAETQVIAVDENGNEIADAQVVTKEDGSKVVVSSSGEVIENAVTATVPSGANRTPTAPAPALDNPSPSPSPAPSPTPSPEPTPTPNPTPNPTPPPPPVSTCGSGGTCTRAQVASHGTQSNCWVIYNNKVYNVTAFVSRHSGGWQVFNNNTCGSDIGQYLKGTREPVSGERYNHSSGDISDINPYFIANLEG